MDESATPNRPLVPWGTMKQLFDSNHGWVSQYPALEARLRVINALFKPAWNSDSMTDATRREIYERVKSGFEEIKPYQFVNRGVRDTRPPSRMAARRTLDVAKMPSAFTLLEVALRLSPGCEWRTPVPKELLQALATQILVEFPRRATTDWWPAVESQLDWTALSPRAAVEILVYTNNKLNLIREERQSLIKSGKRCIQKIDSNLLPQLDEYRRIQAQFPAAHRAHQPAVASSFHDPPAFNFNDTPLTQAIPHVAQARGSTPCPLVIHQYKPPLP